ncbi:hypothetical protein PHISP_02046 [Aspergillus sp. HF37]|nr:hypothetical protein PHISP_02046 [Aspergillus sp. HF37]
MASDHPILSRENTLSQLPPEYPSDAQDQISQLLSTTHLNRVVILDDDPTGTQTCHDISVLTDWDVATLTAEFASASRGFFILTNSRAYPPNQASALVREICENVRAAATSTSQGVDIVLRSDSTLRGHFPLEADVAQAVFGPADAVILAPFFYQGGRFTIADVHYVAEGEDKLVPAGKTQFARDASFGYSSSNLRDYVREKAPGRFEGENEGLVCSVSIADVRKGGPARVCERLVEVPRGGVVVVNAAAESDMHVFVAGLLLGIRSKPPITAAELGLSVPRTTGGLILAGSYVPKTTAQLDALIHRAGGADQLSVIEVKVEDLISSAENADKAVRQAVQDTESHLASGRDTLVMTSRKLITGEDESSSLAIGANVAGVLVKILQQIQTRPRYIIAKGGITSSDAATKGLNVKRATVIGQAVSGVPLWRCDEPSARHPGVPFVVFPGNVGGEATLSELVKAWY